MAKKLACPQEEAAVTNFPDMLQRFAAAVEANDGAGLAALFADDGVYEDGFFGAFAGSAAIAKMVAHFHETAEDFRWEFFDPVADARAGYAHYRFSYRSKMPGAEGRPVAFEGIAHFTLRDGRIARYREVFDRGVALTQQGFAAERIKRVVEKAAARQNETPEFRAHLQRLADRAG